MSKLTLRAAPPSDRGITLLEIVIAVLVLSVGILAAMRSVDHAQRNLGEEAARLFAAQVALNRAEEIRLMGPGPASRNLSDTVPYGPFDWQVQITTEETDDGFERSVVTAGAPGQPGARFVVLTMPGAIQ